MLRAKVPFQCRLLQLIPTECLARCWLAMVQYWASMKSSGIIFMEWSIEWMSVKTKHIWVILLVTVLLVGNGTAPHCVPYCHLIHALMLCVAMVTHLIAPNDSSTMLWLRCKLRHKCQRGILHWMSSRSDVRCQESRVRGQMSGVRSEVKYQRSEVRGQMSDVRFRGQRSPASPSRKTNILCHKHGR